MKFKNIVIAGLLLIMVGCASTPKVAETSVDGKSNQSTEAYQIIDKAESIYSGVDQISTLDFQIVDKDGTKRQVELKRYWKNYSDKKGDILTKTLIFHLFPPESKNTAFMVWSYKHGSNKDDDQWLYLPILRKVNKLPGRDETGFHGSDLKAEDMVSRPADLDIHRIVKEEERDGQSYTVIESKPKKQNNDYKYIKVLKWINKANNHKDYVEYYNLDNQLEKKAHFHWKIINNVHVWEKVEIENPITSSKTVLNLKDIIVDSKISDKTFTERIMKLGEEAIN